jgi:hypothetical protein
MTKRIHRLRSRRSRLYRLSTYFFILFLSIYYLIVFAHWGYMLRGVAWVLTKVTLGLLLIPPVVTLWIAILSVFAGPLTFKMVRLRSGAVLSTYVFFLQYAYYCFL